MSTRPSVLTNYTTGLSLKTGAELYVGLLVVISSKASKTQEGDAHYAS